MQWLHRSRPLSIVFTLLQLARQPPRILKFVVLTKALTAIFAMEMHEHVQSRDVSKEIRCNIVRDENCPPLEIIVHFYTYMPNLCIWRGSMAAR